MCELPTHGRLQTLDDRRARVNRPQIGAYESPPALRPRPYFVSASLDVRALRRVPDRGPNSELERPRHGLERDPRRFHPLIATIARVRSTNFFSVNCCRASSYTSSGT
jgi:hypothetical protein